MMKYTTTTTEYSFMQSFQVSQVYFQSFAIHLISLESKFNLLHNMQGHSEMNDMNIPLFKQITITLCFVSGVLPTIKVVVCVPELLF